MKDIFAGVVAPEYAQLMGVNLSAPGAGDDASSIALAAALHHARICRITKPSCL
jgi:hypothetical protein